MKFNYEGETVRVEEGRPGTRKHLIRYPEIWELDEEVRRQHTELERIYKLPELEWLLVKSVVLQELASLARNGWSAEWARRVIATIDQGSRYVSKIQQERDLLRREVEALKSSHEKYPDVAVQKKD